MFISKRDLCAGLGGGALASFVAVGDAAAKPNKRNVVRIPDGGITLTNGDVIMALLATTPYVEFGTQGPIVYDVSFRACPPCIAFVRAGTPALVQAGYRVRSFVHAPLDRRGSRSRTSAGERASISEIYRTQSTDYFDAWFRSNEVAGFARARNIADLEDGSAGARRVQNGQEKVALLDKLVKSRGAQLGLAFPAFFWERNNGARAMFGYSNPKSLIDMIEAG
jgi:hypothetical protein